jgi:hypothetical protein
MPLQPPNFLRAEKYAAAKGVEVDALGHLFVGRFPLPLGHAMIQFGIQDPLDLPMESESTTEAIHAMNRNARRPKKANKGARPCSRASRREKKSKIGKRKR